MNADRNLHKNSQRVPSKKERQAAYLETMAREGFSHEAAVDAARLIPKAMVKEFRVKY